MGDGNGSICALGRRLHFEALEDRKLLAVLIVNSPLDVVSNDGNVTLREAINAANTDTATELGHVGSGADTIQFAPGLSGQTITLQGSSLLATESVTIDGSGLEDRMTIVASTGQILEATTDGDYSLVALALTGSVFADGNATLIDSEITGTPFGGPFASAAGIEATGNVTVLRSRVAGHEGGGVHSGGNTHIESSTIEGNQIAYHVAQPGGDQWIGGRGGGIFSLGDVTIANSTITGNSAAQDGGGVWANGNVTITNSTVYGNTVGSSFYSSLYEPGRGGGVFTPGNVTVTSSTISGNEAYGSIGGDGYYGPFVYPGLGGGIWNGSGTLTIVGSIIAKNLAYSGNDILAGTGTISAQYSLVGDNYLSGLPAAPLGTPDANGNLIGTFSDPIDPMLGELGDNGGPTHTLALLPNSPAINAGDPLTSGAPMFDQRGAPWVRVSGGRIDMGAFEVQSESLAGDYNDDGIVDAVDYTVWRNTVGSTDDFRADGSGPTVGVPDGVVDAHDYAFWKANYGNTLPPPGSGGLSTTYFVAAVDDSRVEAVREATDVAAVEGERAAPGFVLGGDQRAPANGAQRSVASRRAFAEETDVGLLARWLASQARDADGERESESPWRERRDAEDSDCFAALDDAFELLAL